jgi:hypothetical protein
MPVFEYRALQADGKIAEGQLEADGRQEAFRQMEAKGLRPIRLVERGGASNSRKPGPKVSLISGLRMEVPPQSTNRPYRRALLFAFVPCFLWTPLTVLLQKLLAFSNDTIGMLSLVPLATASAILFLYPSRLQEKRRAARVCMVFLTSLALFISATFLWVGIILFLIRAGVMGAPLPI